jgi:tubulin-specific chaperone C
MHECHNVDVYLHCSSRPIIENCKGIRFAELPKVYAELLASTPDAEGNEPSTSSSQSQIQSQPKNLWNQIDDFKWLKSEPSPNWSLLPVQDAVPDETWREVVPGGPGWSLEDILRSVGIGSER